MGLRQRGTKWQAGMNCYLGKDHTIHANIEGRVKFTRDRVGKKTYAHVLDDEQWEAHLATCEYNRSKPRKGWIGQAEYEAEKKERHLAKKHAELVEMQSRPNFRNILKKQTKLAKKRRQKLRNR